MFVLSSFLVRVWILSVHPSPDSDRDESRRKSWYNLVRIRILYPSFESWSGFYLPGPSTIRVRIIFESGSRSESGWNPVFSIAYISVALSRTFILKHFFFYKVWQMSCSMTKQTKWLVLPPITKTNLGIDQVWSGCALSVHVRTETFFRRQQIIWSEWVVQNCLLVTRQNDNHSPGPWPGKLVPRSHLRSERLPRLIGVFAKCTDNFVDFVVLRLKYNTCIKQWLNAFGYSMLWRLFQIVQIGAIR